MNTILLLVIATSTFYSLQGILYTKYARKYDGLRVAQIRNISMIVTGLPLLLFVNNISGQEILAYRPWILSTAIIGAFHVFISYKAYTYIPAGIGQVVKKAVKSAIVLAISVLVLHEVFSLGQARGLGIVTIGALWLGAQKIDIAHLRLQNAQLGFLFTILAGICSGVSRFFFTKYGNHMDSLLAAYILELSIGIIYLIRIAWETISSSDPHTGIRGLQHIETKDILSMSLITFLVLGGTICMALAFKLGSFGYSGLLTILGVPMSFVLARFTFKEKITRTQALAVGVILVGIYIL